MNHLRVSRVAILGLVVLAFVLRLYHLGAQSLWTDEIASLELATRNLVTLGQLISQGLDDNPPLYHYLLHSWILFVGRSEFALRYLSLIFGSLLIPAVYRIGHLWMGRRVALLAAIVTSFAPVQAYYSQETRMYTLAAILALLSFYLFARLLQDTPGLRLWGAYVLLTSLSLYTHYYSFLVLAAENLFFLLWWLNKKERGILTRWVLVQMTLMLLFLPWAWACWPRIASGGVALRLKVFGAKPRGPLEFIAQIVLGLTLGPAITQGTHLSWVIGGLFLVLLLYGVLCPGDSNGRSMAATYLFVPTLSAYLLDQFYPNFMPRYLLLVAPAYYLLLAYAMGRLPCRGLIGALLVLGPFTYGLFNNYYSPAYFRDDYRSLYALILEESHPGEAIILNAPWQGGSLEYYYRGNLPGYGLPQEYPPGEETVTSLEGIAEKHTGVWVVFYGNASVDPQGMVEGWLDLNGYGTQNRWYGAVRLAHYLFPHRWSKEDIPHRDSIVFGGQLRLLGFGLEKEAPAPGQRIQLTLFWEAVRKMENDYRLSLRLLDGAGVLWAQEDYPFLEGVHPPPTWAEGELVRDQYGLTVPADIPEGVYNLVVLVYSPETLQPLSADSHAFARLAEVRITYYYTE